MSGVGSDSSHAYFIHTWLWNMTAVPFDNSLVVLNSIRFSLHSEEINNAYLKLTFGLAFDRLQVVHCQNNRLFIFTNFYIANILRADISAF